MVGQHGAASFIAFHVSAPSDVQPGGLTFDVGIADVRLVHKILTNCMVNI